MSECERCGGSGYVPSTGMLRTSCPACGGAGKAGEKVKASDADHEEAAAYVAMTKRETMPDLIARVRADGVKQGRAAFEAELKATFGKPGRIIDFTDDPKPMSRRDEFAKAAMVELLGHELSRKAEFRAPAKVLAANVVSLTDAVLAALDKEE